MLEDNARNLAWKRMLEERTCPPIDILREGGPEVEAHLAGCPTCRERLSESSTVYLLVSGQGESCRKASIKPGAVCRLLRAAAPAGLYEGKIWHNPPLVLVLPDRTNVDGMVRVAQIHDASELAGPGDFPLTGPYADCFAESWNTWPAFTDTLEYRGMTSEDLARCVSNYAHKPMPLLDEESTEFWFRRQELSTGGFFGKIAALRGVALLEEQPEIKPESLSNLKAWKKKQVSDFISLWASRPLAAAAASEGEVRPSQAFLLGLAKEQEGTWALADVVETCFGDTVLAEVTVYLPASFSDGQEVSCRAFTDSCEEWHVLSVEHEGDKVYLSLQLPQAVWVKEKEPVPRLALLFENRLDHETT